MKQRVISGIIIGLIALTSVYFGGLYFKAVVAFIGIWGSYEFVKCRKRKINWLEFVIFLTSIILINLFFNKILGIILSLIVILLTISVFDENYSLEDATASFFEIVVLGCATNEMIVAQSYNKWLFGYIIIIAFLTDVFALLCGMKFGKHKLNERISPKKTIEGAIGGWICGMIIFFVYAKFCGYFGFGVIDILICSLILPMISQIGDLIFSLIKRHYDIKDFSKLIPGHGGILDRMDSLIFVLLIFKALKVILGL